MIMKHSLRHLLTVMLSTLVSTSSFSQQKENYSVAIFLYQGVEILDFAGPGEAFSAAGFKVFTVSADGKEILSQNFLTVKPEYSIENAPVPDIIVLPGGSSGPSSRNLTVIDWVKNNSRSGAMTLSVCTGASILAKAGLLNGLNVTTFHGFISGLQAMLPDSKVLENTRFVDNGKIITTAGVSAGIDGALHAISRIKGFEVAKATAFYMEYDKWKPEEGRVDFKNELLEEIKNGQSSSPEQKKVTVKKQIPYEGEMLNLASELIEISEYQLAANVLESAIKWYPNSSTSYGLLSTVYTKLGKAAPIDQDRFMKLIDEGKFDEALSTYEKEHKAFPNWIIFSENALNEKGYHELHMGDVAKAVKIFQLNAKAFPNSYNAFDSLGEALAKNGNTTDAIINYKKSLALNPKNTNAIEVLKKLEVK